MPTEISDHYTVTCTINTHNINVIDKQTSVLRKIRPFRKLDMSVLTKKLTDALLENLETPSTSDCSTQLDEYCETLTKVLDELAPLKSCKPKKRMSCKWYTDEIHLMRQLRRKKWVHLEEVWAGSAQNDLHQSQKWSQSSHPKSKMWLLHNPTRKSRCKSCFQHSE